MTTKVEKTIEVEAPIHAVYNQWTQFEEFPAFMGGVKEVRQLTDTTLRWVAEIAGVKRQWTAVIVEQLPDSKVAWAATEGATNAGAVYFQPVGAGSTLVRLELEYEPEGLVERAGDVLDLVGKQAEANLSRFKEFIEARGSETGGWRGVQTGFSAGSPTVADAAASHGDSGKAGVSAKAVVAGAAAAAAAAGVAAATGPRRDDSDEASANTFGEAAGHTPSVYGHGVPSGDGTPASGAGPGEVTATPPAEAVAAGIRSDSVSQEYTAAEPRVTTNTEGDVTGDSAFTTRNPVDDDQPIRPLRKVGTDTTSI